MIIAELVTPEFVKSVFDGMSSQPPSQLDQDLYRKLVDVSLDNPDVIARLDTLIELILRKIPSCYQDTYCHCQLSGLTLAAICIGMRMANSVTPKSSN